MKKIFFSAIACMAFVGSTFAANAEKEIVNVLPSLEEEAVVPCGFIILIFDRDGNFVAPVRHDGTEDAEDCLELQESLLTKLKGEYPPDYTFKLQDYSN